MQEYNLQYRIENTYENIVRKAYFVLLVIPDNTKIQKVHHLDVHSSFDASVHRSQNMFGFQTLHYSIQQAFSKVWFELNAKLEIEEYNPYNFIPLSKEDEHRILNTTQFTIEHHLFLRNTPLTFIPSEQIEILPLPKFSTNIGVFDFLQEINESIYHYLSYVSGMTDTTTRVVDVLKLKKGVCQDYAHLFIALCRYNNIPARYVSGYLNQGNNLIGASQLHAWAEAFIPEFGWLGFDPTNNLLVNNHYIKIAHGTDYNDCSPIKGVLDTQGQQESKHSVLVTNQ